MSIESEPLVARTGKQGPWHVVRRSAWSRSLVDTACGLDATWVSAGDHASSVGREERRCRAPGCAQAWAEIDAGKAKR